MRTLIVALFLAAGLALAQDLDLYGYRGRDSLGPSNPNGGNATLASLDAGVIYVSDGTAALPAYSWWADSDTGFYRVGANQIGITTNGTRSLVASATPGYLEGTSATPKLILDTSSGACLSYSAGGGANLCASTNTTSAVGTEGFNVATTGAPLKLNSVTVLTSTTPTISSGFGTSPSVTAGKAYAFRVNVGTGGTANSGVIALGTTATNGWNCTCTDLTTQTANVFLCKQTASSTTTATIGNFDAAGAAAAWVASDILAVTCTAL